MIPVVSVVIATFNRQHKLHRALDSVLRQTLKEIEVIVVDNASTDGTEDVVREFNDARVRYLRHDINKGGPAARNTGIKTARGAYIALLDDDDEWMPRKLELQVSKMKEAGANTGLVYGGAEIYDELRHKVTHINRPVFRGNVYERLLLGTILSSVSSVLVKWECFDKVGLFDEELKSCQDWDMWLRIAKCFEFDFVDETLTRINMHGEQISTNFASLIPGRTRMVEKHAEEFARFPKIYVVHLKRVGKLHMINGTWRRGLTWFQKAIAIDPWESLKIGVWCLIELPRVKFFSPVKNFKRYIDAP